MNNAIASHYDTLIDENNGPDYDHDPMKEYMDKWDGEDFINKMELNAEKSVLETGVGTGRLAVKVAPLCKEFYGIDISPKNELNFERQFDVIYSSLIFIYVSEKQKAINLIEKLLAPNGKFVLSIDKNQDDFIDIGTNKIKVYPDKPSNIEEYVSNANLNLSEHYVTEFAHIFVSEYTPIIKI